MKNCSAWFPQPVIRSDWRIYTSTTTTLFDRRGYPISECGQSSAQVDAYIFFVKDATTIEQRS